MGATKRGGGRQKGAQRHDEGEHGGKTTSHLRSAWNSPPVEPDATPGPRYDAEHIASHDTPGKSRLFEDRTQHDYADLNSEKTRLARDAGRHGHVARTEGARRSAQASAKRKS